MAASQSQRDLACERGTRKYRLVYRDSTDPQQAQQDKLSSFTLSIARTPKKSIPNGFPSDLQHAAQGSDRFMHVFDTCPGTSAALLCAMPIVVHELWLLHKKEQGAAAPCTPHLPRQPGLLTP